MSQTYMVQAGLESDNVVEEALRRLKAGESVVVEAYPGYGKTLRLAKRVLEEHGRVLYVARTIRELLELAGKVERATVGYGRPQVCYRMPKSFSYQVCRILRASGKCRENVTRKYVAWLSFPRTPEEIREYARRHGVCMYRALQTAVASRRKLLTTYSYIYSNPKTLNRYNVIVFDEAHTLFNQLYEAIIQVDDLTIQAWTRLLRGEGNHAYANLVKALWKRAKKNIRIIPRAYEKAVANMTGVEETETVEEIEYVIGEIAGNRYYYSGEAVYVLKKPLSNLKQLVWEKPVLLLSAVMPKIIVSKLGLDILEPEPPAKIPVAIDERVDLSYKNRGEGYEVEVAGVINEYIRRHFEETSKPVLVVFPSKQVLRNVEPFLEKHENMILDVAGGTLTEGVNIPELKRVIVVGVPYPYPTPEVKLLSKIYGFDNVSKYIAVLRTVQAVGRLRLRRGVEAVLVDKRFRELAGFLPSWVQIV